MLFQDKVILITGAASGIGAATALQFADLSAQLALVGRSEERLKEILELCEERSGRKPLAVVADLSKLEDVLNVIPKTVEYYGRIDILINNAAIGSRKTITDEDISDSFDRVIDTNLRAPIVLTNKATPYLIKTNGNIVNIGSVRSSRPVHNRAIFCASKAALEMFTKCVALDLADRGVRVNSIHPGVVKTDMIKKTIPTIDVDKYHQSFNEKLPFGVIEPKEVAKLTVFLANNEVARSITGASYYIDGGSSLMESKTLGGKF